MKVVISKTKDKQIKDVEAGDVVKFEGRYYIKTSRMDLTGKCVVVNLENGDYIVLFNDIKVEVMEDVLLDIRV